MSHDYGYDINRIISLSGEQENGSQVEGYALQLDHMLSEGQISPEMENFLDKTIEFLYGIVEG